MASIHLVGATIGSLVGCRPSQKSTAREDVLWSSQNSLPNANAKVMPVPGTRPELTPIKDHYKVMNRPIPPIPDLEKWRLTVKGLVEQKLLWTIDDIKRLDSMSEFITLTCISNPVGGPLSSTTRWTGVSLQKILPLWKLESKATHLKMIGADGFFETIALQTIKEDHRVMLVYAWDGLPLPIEHGYPIRIFIPNRYGMKQPKWIESFEATDHWEPGFSVKNTWDKDAIMKITSVIDTIHVDAHSEKNDGLVHIGGIAHAGSKGISKVEIKVDGGDWAEAQLREPLSELSWVIWRYQWKFREGHHEFAVRAYNKDGEVQKEEESPPYPDGASGFHKAVKSFKE